MEDSQKIKERGAHFTPKDIADFIVRKTYQLIENPEKRIAVLDPACGDGELLLAAYEFLTKLGHDVDLFGVETEQSSLEKAGKRIHAIIRPFDTCKLFCTDFLSCEAPDEARETLDRTTPKVVIPKVDMLVANPPYVRTQVLGSEESQRLSKLFSLSGKTDLYHVFFLNYYKFLKPTSGLGVITSNRYLYTKSGEQVRKHLHEHYKIEAIYDLGDTKVFSAAVLPALLFAQLGNNSDNKTECMRIYERPSKEPGKEALRLVDVLENADPGTYSIDKKTYNFERGHVRSTCNTREPWVLASSVQEKWLDSVDNAAYCRIENVAKVRVGIKTTADNVFIRERWSDLPSDLEPEAKWIFPLISSGDSAKWSLRRKPSLSILYPYYIGENGKRSVVDIERFPGMKAYLTSYYEQLHGRSYVIKAHRRWYEIWVPQDPAAWQNPKLVFPDISSEASFLLDLDGCLVDGNCYWIQLKSGIPEDVLYLILGVANSSLMADYHSLAFQNVLYSGKKRFLTQYVNKYPLPDIQSESAQSLVKYLRSVFDKKESVNQETVDEMVYKAFEVDSFEE